jgi:hypothetical protein
MTFLYLRAFSLETWFWAIVSPDTVVLRFKRSVCILHISLPYYLVHLLGIPVDGRLYPNHEGCGELELLEDIRLVRSFEPVARIG